MADNITVQFTPTPRDYVTTYRALQFRSLFSRIVYVGMGLLELCLIASLFIPGFDPRFWPMAVAIPIFITLAVVWPAYSVGQRAKGNERMLAPITWELSDTGLRMTNGFTEAKYDWGSFQALVEKKDYFLLRHTTNQRLYNFIPKRAFSSAEQMAAFGEMVDRHIARSKGHAMPSATSS